MGWYGLDSVPSICCTWSTRASCHSVTRDGGGGSPPVQDGAQDTYAVRWAKIPMAFTRSYGKYALADLIRLHSEDPDVVHLHCPMFLELTTVSGFCL